MKKKVKKRKWWWYKEYVLPETKVVNLGFNYGIKVPSNLVEKYGFRHKEKYIVFLFKTVEGGRKVYPVYLGSRSLVKMSSDQFGFTIPKSKTDKFQPGEIVYPTILKKNFVTKEQVIKQLTEALDDLYEEIEEEVVVKKLIEEAGLNL